MRETREAKPGWFERERAEAGAVCGSGKAAEAKCGTAVKRE